MTKAEANKFADIMNTKQGLRAEVVRILPSSIDPVILGDNGWDVEITVVWSRVEDRK